MRSSNPPRATGLEAIKLARQRQREATGKISQALVDSFITPIEREDIEELQSALYKISKQAECFADRHALVADQINGIDFAPRAAMLEKAAGTVLRRRARRRAQRLGRSDLVGKHR